MHHLRRFLGLLGILLLCSNQQLYADPYIVAVNVGVPEIFDVEDGNLVGAGSPPYHCVFDHTGENFTFVLMPLKRSLYELDKGRVDVTLPLVREPSRDEYGDFGGHLYYVDYVYLSLRELGPIQEDSGLSFVMLRSFAGLRVLLKDEYAEVFFVNLWEQAPEMLKQGRADAVLIPETLVAGFMEDYTEPYFQQHAGRLGVSFYIARKHRETGLTAKLRLAVDECGQDG